MTDTEVRFTIEGTLVDTRALLDRAANMLRQELGGEGDFRLATALRNASLAVPRVRFPSDRATPEERAVQAMERQADAAALAALLAYRSALLAERPLASKDADERSAELAMTNAAIKGLRHRLADGSAAREAGATEGVVAGRHSTRSQTGRP